MMGVDLMLDGFLGLFGTYKYYIGMTRIWGIFKGFEDWITVLGHFEYAFESPHFPILGTSHMGNESRFTL